MSKELSSKKTKNYISYPNTFNKQSIDHFFLEVENDLKERSKIKNQDTSKVMLLMIALDELKRNKYHLDRVRNEAEVKNTTVDMTSQTTKLMKNLSFVYEALLEQDHIDIDKKSLSKIAQFLIKVVESILVARFNFNDNDLDKFHNDLKIKAPDIDGFIASVIKQQ